MNRALGIVGAVGAVVVGVSWMTGSVAGQATSWPGLEEGWTAPRTPWGVPDLQGIWDSKSSTPMRRPEEYADREFLTDEEVVGLDQSAREREESETAQGRDVRAERGTAADVEGAYNNIYSTGIGTRYSRSMRSSLIVDPPNGLFPPLTPEGEERRAAQLQEFAALRASSSADVPYFVDTRDRYDNPEDTGDRERCMGVTIPCTGGLCGYSRLVQGPGWVWIYYEQGHGGGAYRSIPLDGRPHLPSHIRQRLGDSVGHWEGDTLVVDTTNFTNQTSYMGSGENLHLIERYTRVAPDLLKYEITVEDATVWTRPWTMELAPALQDNVKNLIFESACHEGNYSLTGMLAGARMEEAGAR